MDTRNHGKLIKKLRQERSITQKQLVNGISTRGTLAALENRNSKVSFDILEKYLDRMNITLEEYSFLYKDSVISDKKAVSKYMISDSTDILNAKMVLTNLQSKYNETDDKFYYYTYITNKLLLQFVHNQYQDFSKSEDAYILKEYLDNIETWGRFELSILINCLFIFDTDYIINAIKYRVTKMKLFIDSTYFSKDWSSFIFNGIRISFIRNDTRLREFIFSNISLNSFDSSTFDKTKFAAFKLLHQLSQDKYNQQVKNDLNTILDSIKIIGDNSLYSFLNQIKKDLLTK